MFCRKFGWISIANQGTQNLTVQMFIETSGECASHWTTKVTIQCVVVYNKSIECKVYFKYTCNSSSSMFVWLPHWMPKISRVGRIKLMVYTSISLPVLLDKGNMGNEVSGFREKKTTFPIMWFFLHFTPSLHFTFSPAVCILHPVCILPLVCSLQSSVHSLHFTLTGWKILKEIRTDWNCLYFFKTCWPNGFLKFIFVVCNLWWNA